MKTIKNPMIPKDVFIAAVESSHALNIDPANSIFWLSRPAIFPYFFY